MGRVVHDGAQPLRFVPAVSVALLQHAQVMPADAPAVEVLSSVAPANQLAPTLTLPAGWNVRSDTSRPLPFGEHLFMVRAPAGHPASVTAHASVSLANNVTVAEGYESVGYGDLPRTNLYAPATDRIVTVDLKLPSKKRIAYLPGTGDDVPGALTSLGLQPVILTVSDLNADTLRHFDTVILGVRTYNAHPELHGAPTQALLQFAAAGGNVVVQFQTPEFTAEDAPFPLTLGNAEKVVDETAPVKLLVPGNSLLTRPNAITAADFNGWVEERGHGFLRTWDPRYAALLETHDPGAPEEFVQPQLPQRGGLITANVGKGRWTYCAFALYRQLPEAVPGAYRLLANLLEP